MNALRDALRKRRMEKLGAGQDQMTMGSPAAEHEQSDQSNDLAPSAKQVMSNTEHENNGIQKLSAPGMKTVVNKTAHEIAAPLPDDSEDDDAEMMQMMTKDMSQADMDHSMSSKPKTLGERVRQHALMKRK